MVAYKIFGRSVQPHTLAIVTILGCAAGAALLKLNINSKNPSGSSKEEKPKKENDVNTEKFIDEFLKQYDVEEKK